MPSYETSFAPVIKWSGSKRHQANSILQHFPEEFKSYYEPFVGSGAILYAARPEHAIAGDVCEPLIDLWKVIQKEPDALISHYDYHWHLLQEKGHTIFYEVRDRFNKEQNPCDFFFLSRTCVNGLIRFNKKGEAYFEVRVDEETGRKYWFGGESGWKDPEEVGENGVITMDTRAFEVGTFITMTEPLEALKEQE